MSLHLMREKRFGLELTRVTRHGYEANKAKVDGTNQKSESRNLRAVAVPD